MERNPFVVGIGMGMAAAAGIAKLIRPSRNRQVRRAVTTVGQALGAVPGIMGW